MFENLTEQEALLLVKRGNTAHEDIYTIRRIHVLIFGEFSTPAVLSRIIYWSGKSMLGDGWFYKTAEDLAKEVCCSRSTIMRVKEKLETLNIIITTIKKIRNIPTLHWKLNPKILLALEMLVPDSDCVKLEQSDCVNVIQSDCVTVEQSLLQTTTVQKANIKLENIIDKRKKEKFELPDWVPEEPWSAYVEMRKNGKQSLTDYAKKLNIIELKKIMEETGCSADDIINQSVKNSWKGFFPIKKDSGRKYTKPDISRPKSTKYANIHREKL